MHVAAIAADAMVASLDGASAALVPAACTAQHSTAHLGQQPALACSRAMMASMQRPRPLCPVRPRHQNPESRSVRVEGSDIAFRRWKEGFRGSHLLAPGVAAGPA